MIAFPDLQVLHDRGALYATLTQGLLGDGLDERLGAYSWDVDLEVGKLTYRSDDGSTTLTTGVELLASVAPGPRSLLWGRAMPNGRGPDGPRLLAIGQRESLPSLLADELPIPVAGDDVASAVADAASAIASVATMALGGGLVTANHAGGGAYAVLRVRDITGELAFAAPRIDHRFPLRVPLALGQESIVDQRAALHGLAVLAQWTIDWTPDWSAAFLTDPANGNTAQIDFDSLGRASNLKSSLGPGA